jgi:hypothetical protein
MVAVQGTQGIMNDRNDTECMFAIDAYNFTTRSACICKSVSTTIGEIN